MVHFVSRQVYLGVWYSSWCFLREDAVAYLLRQPGELQRWGLGDWRWVEKFCRVVVGVEVALVGVTLRITWALG